MELIRLNEEMKKLNELEKIRIELFEAQKELLQLKLKIIEIFKDNFEQIKEDELLMYVFSTIILSK